MRETVNPTAEELTWSDEDLLRAFGCVKIVDGRLKPTVTGILLFGTPKALRRCFPMMRIDYIRVSGRQWVENLDNLASNQFADYVMHEAAHIFHNTKRMMIGLPEIQHQEWQLPIDFMLRETFAYAIEAYNRIRELAKKPAERRALFAELASHPLLTVPTLQHRKTACDS